MATLKSTGIIETDNAQFVKLTNAKFAQLCAYIATNAAKWAGDMLDLPENHQRPVDAKTVKRFTDEVRGRLDRLDELAGIPSPERTGNAPGK